MSPMTFDSNEDAPDSIEDEHHAIFECSGYATTRQMFSDFLFQPCIHCQPVSEPACLQLPGQVFDLDQDVTPEHSLV